MVLRTKEQVVAKPVERAVKAEIAWLIDRHDGAPNFELRKFTIKPGGRIPKHYHHDIEHEQYVLAGNYDVGIGEKVHKVKEGDSLFVPAGTVHWYENKGKADAEFLCIVPKKERYDAVYIEEAKTLPNQSLGLQGHHRISGRRAPRVPRRRRLPQKPEYRPN
jgi:quercetin dioxygenase-like cupin family protein